MKKITTAAITALLALTASCERSIDVFEARQINFDLYVGVESSGTKTYLDSFMNMHWNSDDCLSVFLSEKNVKFGFTGQTGDTEGVFKKEEGTYGDQLLNKVYVAYPYSTENRFDTETGQMIISYPQTQTYFEGSFDNNICPMVSTVLPGDITSEGVHTVNMVMKNLASVMVVNLYGGDKIKKIILEGNNGEILSGEAHVDFDSADIPTATMSTTGGTSITLNCGEGVTTGTTADRSKSFYFVLPPITFEKGFKITVIDDNSVQKIKSTDKKVILERSHILNLSGLTFHEVIETKNKVMLLFGDSITTQAVAQKLRELLAPYTDVQYSPDGYTEYRDGWKVVLSGVGSEKPIQIAARQGAVPIFIKEAFTIPANPNEAVYIGPSFYTTWNDQAFVNETPTTSLTFITSGIRNGFGWESETETYTGCVNPFKVNGIECAIKKEESGLYLSRISQGETDVHCDAYTQAVPYIAWKYKDAAVVSAYMGANGGYNKEPGNNYSYSTLAKFYDAMMAYSGDDTRYVVTSFHQIKFWNPNMYDYFTTYYADHYDVGKNIYLNLMLRGGENARAIASELGFVLTAEDETLIDGNPKQWPQSWQSNDGTHPNDKGHKVYATLVFKKMQELGYVN